MTFKIKSKKPKEKVYEIKTKTKGFSYQKHYQNLFRVPIKVEKVAENQYTGQETALVSTKTTPKRYWIVYTDEDAGNYGTDKKKAFKHFKERHNI